MIKLLLVDDSEIHLEGMKSILKPYENLRIVHTAQTVQETKNILKENNDIDVILLDISLEEESDGLTLAEFIHDTYPAIATIILSHYKDVSYIIRTLKLKLNGYVAKDTKPACLVSAIEAVYEGKGFYFGNTTPYAEVVKAFGSEKNMMKGCQYELSEREMEVVRLLANGCTSKDIAKELDIDRNTVETYKERIKSKLGCKSAIEIVVFAYKNKILF